MTYTQARVAITYGDRGVCQFMANAGLDITGVGTRQLMTIDYKPGEVVDTARVAAALEKMKQAANEDERSPFTILSWEVIGLQQAEVASKTETDTDATTPAAQGDTCKS